MDRKELLSVLENMHIPRSAICLDGGLPHDAYVLARNGPKWEVYYSERGGKTEPIPFDTEAEACAHLYSVAKTIEARYRDAVIINKASDIRVVDLTKGSLDVFCGGRTLRIWGDLCVGGPFHPDFAANPADMEWLPPYENEPISRRVRAAVIKALRTRKPHNGRVKVQFLSPTDFAHFGFGSIDVGRLLAILFEDGVDALVFDVVNAEIPARNMAQIGADYRPYETDGLYMSFLSKRPRRDLREAEEEIDVLLAYRPEEIGISASKNHRTRWEIDVMYDEAVVTVTSYGGVRKKEIVRLFRECFA